MYNSAIFIIKCPGGARVWWGQMQTELSIAQTLFLVREMEAWAAVRAALFEAPAALGSELSVQ